jgi:4-carboxymuconolactone decarboxylase
MRFAPFKTEEETPDYAKAAYEHVLSTRGNIPGPSGVLLRAPEVGVAFSDLCGALRGDSLVTSGANIELAISLTANVKGNPVIWASHSRSAIKQGVSEETIQRLERGEDPEDPDSDAGIVVAFGRAVLSGEPLSDDQVQPALDRFGDRGIIELTAAIGAYSMADCVIRVAGLKPKSDRS